METTPTSWASQLLQACKVNDVDKLQTVMAAFQTNTSAQSQLARYLYLALRCSAFEGHLEAVEFLLAEAGSRILASSYIQGSDTALMAAARQGHFEICRILVIYGLERVNALSKGGVNALYHSAHNGHLDITKFFIRNGANRASFSSALIAAGSQGHVETVKFLLEQGAKVDVNFQGGTPLMFAVRNCHFETAKVLLKRGASLRISVNSETCLRAAIRCAQPREMLTMLIRDFDANIEEIDRTTGENLLEFSSRFAYYEAFRTLVDLGAKLRKTNELYLVQAVQFGDLEQVHYLLDLGLKASGALSEVLKLKICNIEVLKELLATGSRIQVHHLSLSVVSGNCDCFKVLLEHGADWKWPISEDLNCLSIAAGLGNLDIVRCILELKRDPPTRRDMDTALLFAAYNGHTVVVKLLLNSGASIEAKSQRKSSSPIFLATLKGHLETVRFLTSKGASVDVANKDGITPLECAKRKGHVMLAEFLTKQSKERLIN